MDRILSEFKTTTVYQKFVSNPDCICLVVGGSRQIGLADSQSDYDLAAIFVNRPTDALLTHGSCAFQDEDNEIIIHWYLLDLENIFFGGPKTRAKRFFFLGKIAEAEKLFVNTKFELLLNEIQQSREELLRFGALSAIEGYQQEITKNLAQGWIDWTKGIYHFLTFITPLTHQEPDKQLLMNIKRHNIRELGKKDNKFVLDQMRKVADLSWDIKNESKNLYERLKKIQQDCLKRT